MEPDGKGWQVTPLSQNRELLKIQCFKLKERISKCGILHIGQYVSMFFFQCLQAAAQALAFALMLAQALMLV